MPALAAALLGAAAAQAQVPSFTGVGDLPGGAASSAALDVSADGAVVVGESESTSGTQAFRWTSSGGIAGLGFLSGVDPYSTANAVSANGSVVAGTSNGSDGIERAYRWSGGTMTALGRFTCTDCDPITKAWGISNNGLVVVGSALARSSGSSPLHLDPVRWPSGGTAISDLGNLSGPQDAGEAFGASPTGSIIVGTHFSTSGKDAWRWQGSGLVALAHLIGGSVIAAEAHAVSNDGSTIVGYSNAGTLTLPGGTVVASDLQAVRWTGANFGTIQSLGPLPGAAESDSASLAVSPDGSIIVGRATGSDLDDHAFIWNAGSGMQDLKTVLVEDYGLDLTGWVLSEATGISDVASGDFTIVGRGINPQGQPEGFVAFLSTPACDDGGDNDGDTLTDYPADPGCTSPADWSEEFDCDDGLDNDGDDLIDYPADPECESAADFGEEPQCSDAVDNDGDGRTDYPDQYPGCLDANDPIEAAQCDDGVDNDGDTAIDHPADTGCSGPTGPSENPVALVAGNLIAVDRTSRAVFRVDVATGAQTLISQAAHLLAPQGVAQRGNELVVADPAGLVTVAGSAVQRLASPPLAANESLQVAFDAVGNGYVVESSGISKVAWNHVGIGAKSTWLAVPTPEPVPVLSLLFGDALAREPSGSFVTSGLSFSGDGVYRVTPPTPSVAILRPGIENLKWLDLAVEANGTILAVGDKGAQTGVYRVNPTTGVSTPLNESFAWVTPTGVAVAPNGQIYVADSGSGSIVRVNPGSGAVTPLASGGFIAGELDVVVLPEPARLWMWLAGLAALAALHRAARHSRPAPARPFQTAPSRRWWRRAESKVMAA